MFCNDFFSNYNSTFVQLVGGKNEAAKAAMFISGEHRFNKTNEQLREIQGTPYTAYWASDVVLSAFKKSHLVGDVSEPRVGMATANNDRFIRLWFEVNRNKFGINISSRKEAVESRKKWFPFAKGGEQRNGTVIMIQ